MFAWSAGPSLAQDLSGPNEPDTRLEQDRRVLADTAIGPITVGVSGLNDDPSTPID